MGWESSAVFRFDLGSLSRSNDGSLTLMSCLFGGYKFALVVRCVGLVCTVIHATKFYMEQFLSSTINII